MANKGSLKDRFENYGAAPKAGAWEGIASALPVKNKKVAILWWISGGIAAAASIALFWSVLNGGFDTPEKNVAEIKNNQIEIDNVNDSKQSVPVKDLDASLDNGWVKTKDLAEASVISEEAIATNNQKQKSIPEMKVTDDGQTSKIETNLKEIKNTAIVMPEKEEVALAKNINSKTKVDDMLELRDVGASPNENIELLAAQSGPQIELAFDELRPSRIITEKQRDSRWLVGLKLLTDAGFGSNEGPTTFSSTQTSEDFSMQLQEANENPIGTSFPLVINRPLSVAFLLRYKIGRRFFMEIDPRIQLYRIQSELPLQSSLSTSPKNYYSFGGGLSLGCNIIKRRRWAVDIAAGVHADRLRYESAQVDLLAEESKTTIISQFSTSIGINYQLSDKSLLRLAPTVSLPLNFSSGIETSQIQYQKFGGISFSLLHEL